MSHSTYATGKGFWCTKKYRTTLYQSLPCLSATSVARWEGGKENVKLIYNTETAEENAIIIIVTIIINILRRGC